MYLVSSQKFLRTGCQNGKHLTTLSNNIKSLFLEISMYTIIKVTVSVLGD